MIILDSTLRKLQLKLSGATTTNELPFVVSYVDITSTTFIAGSSNGLSSGASSVDVLSAPGAATQRQVKFLSVQNNDTASATVTVIYNDNGTQRTIWKGLLAVGDNLQYTDGEGFRITNSDGSIKTASVGGGSGILGVSAGTASMSSGTLSFANSNGVSFGLNGSTLTASVATNYQSQGAYLTTAMASSRGTDFLNVSGGFSGTNISGTLASNGLQLSVAAGGGGADGYNILAAGSQTANTTGSVLFNNANGITFGMSNSSVITASYNSTQFQTAGAYLTTARASNDAIGTNTALTANGVSMTANSSGLSLNFPAFLTTADLSQNSSKYAGINGAITGGSITVNTSGVSINLPAYLTTAMASNRGSDFLNVSGGFSGTNISGTLASNGLQLSVAAGGGGADGYNILAAGTQTANTTGSVLFNNANGITFGMSNSSVITASYNSTQFQTAGAYLTTARASNDAIGLNSALTANGVSMTANSSGLSLNFPAFLTTADLSQNSSRYALTGFTTTTAAGSVIAGTHDTNGLKLGVPAFLTTAQAPGAYLTTARASNDAVGLNTALTANGVSWTVNSSGISLNVPAFLTTQSADSVGFYAISNTTGQSSSSTVDIRSLSFVGAGIASVGMSAGSMIFSVPSGGGAGDGGNTLAVGGSTAGSNSLVLFSNSPTVTFGMAGNTITASAAGGGGGGVTLAEWEPVPGLSTFGTSLAQNSMYINTLLAPNNITAKYMLMGVVMTGGWTTSTPVTNSTATTGSSGSASAGQSMNFYMFTDGTGGLESNLYTMATAQLTFSTNISWSQTNSNTTTGTQSIGSTMGFTYGLPVITSGTMTSVNAASTVTTWGSSTGAFTGTSTFSTNGTSTSGWPGGTSNATWAGSRMLWVPLNTSFSGGEYWMGIQRSSTTAGFAVAGTYSFLAQSFTSYDSNSRWAPLGYATSQLSFLSAPFGHVNGMFSTSYNATSNYAGGFGSAGAIAKTHVFGSSVTNTSGTVSRFYNRFMAEIF
jgi:hypothetical protein